MRWHSLKTSGAERNDFKGIVLSLLLDFNRVRRDNHEQLCCFIRLCPVIYSLRRVFIGSMLAARLAGKRAARIAARIKAATATTIDKGSLGEMPK